MISHKSIIFERWYMPSTLQLKLFVVTTGNRMMMCLVPVWCPLIYHNKERPHKVYHGSTLLYWHFLIMPRCTAKHTVVIV